MMTASRSYPCGTRLRVTNKKTGKSVIVRVGDWGPASWTGRALDLNRAAFARIAPVGSGQINVRYQVLSMGNCRIHAH
jgi:rare lipoprotein A